MALVLQREGDETPLDAALRVASRWGLEKEVQNTYDALIEQGETPEQAAWGACADWDVLAWKPDEKTAARIEARELEVVKAPIRAKPFTGRPPGYR